MSKDMEKKRRDELHRLWLDITGAAVTAIHRSDGYKGVLVAGHGYELIRPECLKNSELHGESEKQEN